MYWYDKLIDIGEKLMYVAIGITVLLIILIVISIIKTIALFDIEKNNDLIVMENMELKQELKEIKNKLDKKN